MLAVIVGLFLAVDLPLTIWTVISEAKKIGEKRTWKIPNEDPELVVFFVTLGFYALSTVALLFQVVEISLIVVGLANHVAHTFGLIGLAVGVVATIRGLHASTKIMGNIHKQVQERVEIVTDTGPAEGRRQEVEFPKITLGMYLWSVVGLIPTAYVTYLFLVLINIVGR